MKVWACMVAEHDTQEIAAIFSTLAEAKKWKTMIDPLIGKLEKITGVTDEDMDKTYEIQKELTKYGADEWGWIWTTIYEVELSEKFVIPMGKTVKKVKY